MKKTVHRIKPLISKTGEFEVPNGEIIGPATWGNLACN